MLLLNGHVTQNIVFSMPESVRNPIVLAFHGLSPFSINDFPTLINTSFIGLIISIIADLTSLFFANMSWRNECRVNKSSSSNPCFLVEVLFNL